MLVSASLRAAGSLSCCAGPTLLCLLQQGEKRRLWTEVPLEEQGMIPAAADGEVVQPTLAIVHAPERDTGNRIAVTEVNAEQVSVAPGQRGLNVGGSSDG